MAGPRRPDSPFWVESGAIQDDRLRLSREESHHLLHVHRARAGALFEAIDGQGTLYECALESVERSRAVGRILERRAGLGELPCPVHLLTGLPDWSAAEQIVSLCVPLGVRSLDLVSCERSGRRALGPERLERLTRLARAGLKQSRRTLLPEIRSSASLEEAVSRAANGPRFVADPEGSTWILERSSDLQGPVTLAVGPPGGFAESERGCLAGARFEPICLGPNRLATETAAVAMVVLARNLLI